MPSYVILCGGIGPSSRWLGCRRACGPAGSGACRRAAAPGGRHRGDRATNDSTVSRPEG
ncbi:hypothetical protein CHLRE_11g467606v5 [Chlamydomonas reinhardtii]|uniref:Uncharacterized protein n=1 Tax=Chlamydomonas reinhardtii TaxID=3055 RepID=A0A2K3D7E9_CHLRE|nr:uncharacterized protein CHLRE_11g467606v5 [Chlamydomonas reinhardtii]PNW76458.1 hypothetical protein CHLRE_11g467606v5 [Chlamydomonas reinhardtii]